MKLFSIYLVSLLVAITACSTLKHTKSTAPRIVKADYHNWNKPPIQGSTIPERGADLTVIVKNFPSDAAPQSIIYNHYKSFPPHITDTTDAGVVMNARIITASSVLQTISQKTGLSNRLIYKTADGKSHFLKIDDWAESEK
jgi:hypothetical protein